MGCRQRERRNGKQQKCPNALDGIPMRQKGASERLCGTGIRIVYRGHFLQTPHLESNWYRV